MIVALEHVMAAGQAAPGEANGARDVPLNDRRAVSGGQRCGHRLPLPATLPSLLLWLARDSWRAWLDAAGAAG